MGLCISLSAASTLTMPRPFSSHLRKSSISNAGSPKNMSAPWLSKASSWRWIVPTLALGDVAVLARQLSGILGAGHQHRLQVVEVEQQQALVVGIAEGDVEHAFLRFVEPHQPRQQQRTHFGDRGADRVALLAVEVPEHRRVVAIGIVGRAQFLGARFELGGVLEGGAARHRDARQGRPSRRPGTPARPAAENCSAMVCSVTVLPVPVAPAIRPWRLARPSSSVCRWPSALPPRKMLSIACRSRCLSFG